MKRILIRGLWVVPIAMSLIALAPLPYNYYTALRLVVCACSAYLAFIEFSIGRSPWAFPLASIAVVFNPLLPLHLDRELWSILNVATAVLLAAHFFLRGRKLVR